MTPEERKEFVRRAYEDVFNTGNLAAAEEYFGADFVNHAGPPDWPCGPEGVRRTVMMLRTAFPDLRYTIEEVIVEGETIAARWTAHGTHHGELHGPIGSIPATGQPVAFQGITMGRVVGGKAGESWVMRNAAIALLHSTLRDYSVSKHILPCQSIVGSADRARCRLTGAVRRA